MIAKELAEKTEKQLNKILLDTKKDLEKYTLDVYKGKEKNTAKVKAMKRDIARILTVLKNKEVKNA